MSVFHRFRRGSPPPPPARPAPGDADRSVDADFSWEIGGAPFSTDGGDVDADQFRLHNNDRSNRRSRRVRNVHVIDAARTDDALRLIDGEPDARYTVIQREGEPKHLASKPKPAKAAKASVQRSRATAGRPVAHGALPGRGGRATRRRRARRAGQCARRLVARRHAARSAAAARCAARARSGPRAQREQPLAAAARRPAPRSRPNYRPATPDGPGAYRLPAPRSDCRAECTAERRHRAAAARSAARFAAGGPAAQHCLVAAAAGPAARRRRRRRGRIAPRAPTPRWMRLRGATSRAAPCPSRW